MNDCSAFRIRQVWRFGVQDAGSLRAQPHARKDREVSGDTRSEIVTEALLLPLTCISCPETGTAEYGTNGWIAFVKDMQSMTRRHQMRNETRCNAHA